MKSRLLATFALAAMLLSQAGSFVHFIAIEHTTCPEHGELIEASAAHYALASASAEPAIQAGGEAASHDDDQHCTIAVAAPHAAVLRATSVSSSVAHAVEHEAAVARVFVAQDLYRLAPKSSPPSNA